jgi:hypothetical protein
VLYTGALETTGKSDNGRADVISIQMAGGKSQMLAVMFLHDLHTASLENQDCSTCHLKDDDKQYSFKFMRTVDFDYEVNMTVYHRKLYWLSQSYEIQHRHDKSGYFSDNKRKVPYRNTGFLIYE